MNESKGKFICPNAIITIEFSPIIMNIVFLLFFLFSVSFFIFTTYIYYIKKRLDFSSPLFGYFDPLLLIAACTTMMLVMTKTKMI